MGGKTLVIIIINIMLHQIIQKSVMYSKMATCIRIKGQGLTLCTHCYWIRLCKHSC